MAKRKQKPEEIRDCKGCTARFYTRRNDRAFCSDRCRNAFWIKRHPRRYEEVADAE